MKLLEVLGSVRGSKMREKFVSKTNEEHGVTLIELLAVIVILAIIAAVAVPVVLNSIKTSKENTTKQDMAIIAEALSRYAADNNGSYPSTSGTGWHDLNTLASDPLTTGGSAAYLNAIPQDAWGADFQYKSDGTTYILATYAAVTTPSGTVSGSGDEMYEYTDSSSEATSVSSKLTP